MQKIVRNQSNIHPIFDDIDRFYTYTSEEQDKKLFSYSVDNSFKYLTELFENYGNFECDVNFIDKSYEKLKIPKSDNKTIMLAFSGGKDSTATALYFMDKGYNVVLYHLKGINQTYKDEWKTCEILAKQLNLPLVIETVSISGSHIWVEHPMKNMVIANSMIQYCLKNNIFPNIAFGNFQKSSLETEPFDVCGGDCNEMWKAYSDIIHKVIPAFKIKIPFKSMKDTWENLFRHKDILPYTQSCIGPFRYRQYLKQRNEEKYHIQLADHVCGSCWKCALEYCVYADNDIQEYNAGYYAHCLEILRKTYKKEYGIKPNIDELWNYYFTYSRSKSKFFEDDF